MNHHWLVRMSMRLVCDEHRIDAVVYNVEALRDIASLTTVEFSYVPRYNIRLLNQHHPPHTLDTFV